jgi:hypothetical protein
LWERVAEGTLPVRGKSRRLKVQKGAFDDLVGHESGAVPEDHLRYQVVSDNQASRAETDRALLGRLQAVLDWQPFDGAEESRDHPRLPEMMIDGLKRGTAGGMIFAWVELRTIETVLDEIAVEFEGADPLKPRNRETLEATKQKLLKLKGELEYFRMEVLLREPLPEELDDMRAFVQEKAS